MSHRGTLRHDRASAAALFVAFLALYLATLTRVHTFDALSYVTSVERKPWSELFHPHHLAYGPLGAAMLVVGQALGYQGGAALPMQLVNAIAGAAGVALFYLVARTATGRSDPAAAAALLLGASYAYWYYAVEIEVYTFATLFLIICMALMARPGPWNARRCMALGLAQGGAVLFHQTNVLLSIPIALIALANAWRATTGREPAVPRQRWSTVTGRWTYYAGALALAVGLPYMYVMLVISNFRTVEAMLAWLTEYARTGWWGSPFTLTTLAHLGTGLADSMAQPGGAWFWLTLGFIVLWAWSGRATWERGNTSDEHRRALHPHLPWLIVWLITYGIFFAWWEPDNIEFWIASLPPALLLLALALSRAQRWGPPIWSVLAIAAAMLWINAGAINRRGDPATDLQRLVARELAARSTPADLLIVPDGLLELYLPYYEQHENFLSLNQALFDNSGSWEAACAAIHDRIDTVQHAGAAVLIAAEALRPPPRLLARHHLDQQRIDACFARYRDTLIGLDLPPPLPAYVRLPAAMELATANGWTFRTDARGWRGANIAMQRFDGGWRFIPQVDPWLSSPLLNLDTRRVAAIEIRMAHTVQARDAQLFYAGTDGAITEEHSVRWELAATTETVTYTIDLRNAPGWSGTVTRLRIDPIGTGDGGEIRVEQVRLIPAADDPARDGAAPTAQPMTAAHRFDTIIAAISGPFGPGWNE